MKTKHLSPIPPGLLPPNTQALAEAEEGLDEALTREEFSHFQKQFFELYAQMGVKQLENKRAYIRFNTLADIKEYRARQVYVCVCVCLFAQAFVGAGVRVRVCGWVFLCVRACVRGYVGVRACVCGCSLGVCVCGWVSV